MTPTRTMADKIAREVPQVAASIDRELAQMVKESDNSYVDPATWAVTEVARGLSERASAGDTAAQDAMIAMACVMEQVITGNVNDLVDHLIDGFLIYIPSPGDSGDAVYHGLGPLLRARVDAERNFRNPGAVTAFINRLIEASPALASLADEHRFGYHHEVLPTLFLGAVATRMQSLLIGEASLGINDSWDSNDQERVRKITTQTGNPKSEVRTVLETLETEASCSPDIENVIAVGFVEALPYDDEPRSGLIDLLGTRLRAALDAQRNG